MPRHPDEIMTDFDDAAKGRADLDIHEILWEIIYDILDSVKLADPTPTKDVYTTVEDYVGNHYGDD